MCCRSCSKSDTFRIFFVKSLSCTYNLHVCCGTLSLGISSQGRPVNVHVNRLFKRKYVDKTAASVGHLAGELFLLFVRRLLDISEVLDYPGNVLRFWETCQQVLYILRPAGNSSIRPQRYAKHHVICHKGKTIQYYGQGKVTNVCAFDISWLLVFWVK